MEFCDRDLCLRFRGKRPEPFGGRAEGFLQALALSARIKSTPAATGFQEVMLPVTRRWRRVVNACFTEFRFLTKRGGSCRIWRRTCTHEPFKPVRMIGCGFGIVKVAKTS